MCDLSLPKSKSIIRLLRKPCVSVEYHGKWGWKKLNVSIPRKPNDFFAFLRISVHEGEFDTGQPHWVTAPWFFSDCHPRNGPCLPGNSWMSYGGWKPQDISHMKILESEDFRTRKALQDDLILQMKKQNTRERGNPWKHVFQSLELGLFNTSWSFCAAPL